MHSAFELIQLTEKHVPGLLRLSRQAGWPDYDERELLLLVKHGRLFGYQNSQGDVIPASVCFRMADFLLLDLLSSTASTNGGAWGSG